MNIQSLVSSKKLSSTGADWLRTAVDPFHDYRMNLEGFPDEVCSLSKVQVKTGTMTLSSPDGNAYSARVWLSPSANHYTLYSPTSAGNWTYNVDTSAYGTHGGGLVAEVWNLAQDPNSIRGNSNMKRTAIPLSDQQSRSRVIACGFEIHNTTPVLNVSGTLTVSTLPASDGVSTVLVSDTTNGVVGVPYATSLHMLPPTTSADALLVPGATQWNAREGAYVIPKIAKPTLAIQKSKLQFDVYTPTGDTDDATFISSAYTVSSSGTDIIVPNAYFTHHGFSRPYVILEGLSAESTFTVTLRSYVESFPDHSDSDLMPMCTPSPPFDFKALALYALISPELPTAVKVNMNASKKYFGMVMDAINSVIQTASPILSTAFPEFAPIIAGASGVANTVHGLIGQARKPNQDRPPLKIANKKKKKKMRIQRGYGKLGGFPGSG